MKTFATSGTITELLTSNMLSNPGEFHLFDSVYIHRYDVYTEGMICGMFEQPIDIPEYLSMKDMLTVESLLLHKKLLWYTQSPLCLLYHCHFFHVIRYIQSLLRP